MEPDEVVDRLQAMDESERTNCLERLSYREREILKLRYGFGDGYSYNLREIATIFKTNPDEVLTVIAVALETLGGIILAQENP